MVAFRAGAEYIHGKVGASGEISTMTDPTCAYDESRLEPTMKTTPAGAASDSAEVDSAEVAVRLEAGGNMAVVPAIRRFADYELLHEVARGGMGIVYRARQVSLDRIVALKMILAGRLATDEDLQRFRTEAEAAGRLQHPNIVKVYEVGEAEGQHFFSMEFVEGKSLAQLVQDGGPLPGRNAARYVRLIARAMHHAHRQGILHRDLKPSNILIDAEDEPRVTDFGLAKRLGGDSEKTRTGMILGTPSYMSPEQAAGNIRDLGPACDIYGLGAILYDLLTGRPPFQADSPLETVRQVLDHDPVPPQLLNPNVDAVVDTICLKCLEKDPFRRYATADVLAEDLQRYLNDEPITARSFNVFDRLARTLDRSRHDIAFHTWSTMVLLIAAIIFVAHAVIYALTWLEHPHEVIVAARLSQFVFIGLVFWKNRGSRLLPTSSAERELWTIWIGYMLAYGVTSAAVRILILHGIITGGANPTPHWEELILYPFSSMASGLAFFIMGCNYWGRLYAVGVAFFVLSMLMPLHLEWAPLEFGTLWAAALLALGLRLEKLDREANQRGLTRRRNSSSSLKETST